MRKLHQGISIFSDEHPHKDKIPQFLLMLTSLIWGVGFIVTNMAVKSGLPVSMGMAIRFGLPAVVMAYLFRREIALAERSEILFGMRLGTILFVAFLAQTYCFAYTTPAICAFLTSTNVIMVPFIAWAICKVPPSRSTLFMTVLCFVGAAILSWQPGVGLRAGVGEGLALLSALLYASQISYVGLSHAQVKSTSVLTFTQLATCGVWSFLYFLVMERQLLTVENFVAGLGPSIFLGVFNTGLCYFLQTWAQRKVEPAQAAVILSGESLFGSIFSVMIGYDRLTVNFVIGGSIILFSVVMAQLGTSAVSRYAQRLFAARNRKGSR